MEEKTLENMEDVETPLHGDSAMNPCNGPDMSSCDSEEVENPNANESLPPPGTQSPSEAPSEPRTIQLQSSKTTLAVRPWKLGAIEVPVKDGNGVQRTVWVAAIVDANGKTVCCGDTVDMQYIIKLENSYDAILKAINDAGIKLADAVDVLQDFECKKTKAFVFNK